MKHRRKGAKKDFDKKAPKKNYNPTKDTGQGSYNIIMVKGSLCTYRAYMGPWQPPKK